MSQTVNQLVYLRNFLFLEVTSLGFAYLLIQKYTNETHVKVFEASPTPRGASFENLNVGFVGIFLNQQIREA